MGTADLLEHLRSVGLVLTLTGSDKLHVAPRAALNDEHRAAIRAERDALVQALKSEVIPTRRSGNPLMTPEQSDTCHAGGWDDTEIASFTTHVLTFVRRGVDPSDADDLAERLVLRDRDQDDRHLCLECSNLMPSGRCHAAARGHLVGVDPRMEPVPTILVRCEGFSETIPS